MKCHMVVLTVIAGAALAAAGPQVIESKHSISLKQNGKVLWTYHHYPAEGKPYFHPLATPEGTVITDLRPEDHPWHRGMWFSWKYIDGVNYWEENRETGLSQGRTRLLVTERKVAESQEVYIRQVLEYAPGEQSEAVMKEERRIRISTPDATGSYTIDWSAEFEALKPEVLLDRTPIEGEENGKSFGGYAGLSIRMNGAMRQGKFINRSGLKDREGHGKSSKWTLFQHPKAGSLLFVDHAGNLNHPAPWYIAPGMPYFSPAPLFQAPYILKQEGPLVLRYRVIVSPKPVNPEQADAWASGFGR